MIERPSELALRVDGVLPAPREQVFRTCSEPDELAKWWGPHGFTTPSLTIDLRVGGGYRIAMQPPEGELFYLTGEFLEVNPPSVLAYTFWWEDPDPDDRVTLVTMSLRDLGKSTELAVVQGMFATEGRRALHHGGWTDGLERLRDVFSPGA